MLSARTLCACRARGLARREHCALRPANEADDLNAINSLLLPMTAMVLWALTSCFRAQGASFHRADCAGCNLGQATVNVRARP